MAAASSRAGLARSSDGTILSGTTQRVPLRVTDRERAEGIAALVTQPSVVAARSTAALNSKGHSDIRTLVTILEVELGEITAGDYRRVRDILGGQLHILQALTEHCAWRFASSKSLEATRVFGALLLQALRQSAQTSAVLESLPLPVSSSEVANELLDEVRDGERLGRRAKGSTEPTNS